MDSLKVTMLACGFAGGGMAKSVALLTAEFAARGYHIVTGFPDNQNARDYGKDLFRNIPQIQFDPRIPDRAAPSAPGQISGMVSFLRDNPSDIVVMHEPAHRLRLSALLAMRFACRSSFVVTIHGQVKKIGHVKKLHQRLCSLCVRQVVVATDWNRKQLAADGVPDHMISVVRYGIPIPDRHLRRLESRDALGIPQDAFVFGCVSRFEGRKCIPNLIRAFGLLGSDSSNAILLIVGDGPDKAFIDESVAKAGNTNIRVLGYVSDPSRVYSAMDIFVLPSVNEAFGMVYIEAGQFGVPCIGVRDSGVPEAILDGQTGLLVEPYDEQGLAEALRKLMRDQALRQELGRNGQTRAEREFSPAAMTDGYIRSFGVG